MVDMRSILRGSTLRVLPGFLLGWAVLILSSPYSRSSITVERVALSVLAGCVAAAGSAIALSVMRRRLRADAAVAGRRAFLVGLGSVGIVVTIRPFLSAIGTTGELAVIALSAAALTTGMFLPWLTRRAVEPASALEGDPRNGARTSTRGGAPVA